MTIPELKEEIRGNKRAAALLNVVSGIMLSGVVSFGFSAGDKIVQHSGDPAADVLATAALAFAGITSILAARQNAHEAGVYLAEQLAQERQQTPPPTPAP